MSRLVAPITSGESRSFPPTGINVRGYWIAQGWVDRYRRRDLENTLWANRVLSGAGRGRGRCPVGQFEGFVGGTVSV